MATTFPETTVRMGELAVSATAGDVLVTIGLGSCIGLALVDRRRRVAGLAHIMLPDSTAGSTTGASARFADVAVPRLVDGVVKAGGARPALEAVLVGGASMFSFGQSALDIGKRNEESTRALLENLRIPILAAATAGTKGRTVRVYVSGPVVVARAVGEAQVALLGSLEDVP